LKLLAQIQYLSAQILPCWVFGKAATLAVFINAVLLVAIDGDALPIACSRALATAAAILGGAGVAIVTGSAVVQMHAAHPFLTFIIGAGVVVFTTRITGVYTLSANANA
jgi:hypothetical protein